MFDLGALRFMRSMQTSKLFVGSLIFIFLSVTLMAVSPFIAEAAAPDISMGGWKDGQVNIIVQFDQPVHDGAGGPITASDLTVAGANQISIDSVQHGPGEDEALIVLSGALNSGGGTDFTITCASGGVFNMDSEECSSSPVNVYTSIPEDTTGPSVAEVLQIDETRLFIGFDEFMDSATAVTGNYTLTTSDGGDDETITAVQAFPDGVEIEASGAVIGAGSGNTIEVTTSVTDIFGNASGGETITILPGLKISEVRIGTTPNTRNEFIEIYNMGPAPVDLAGLHLHIWDGSTDTDMALTQFIPSIPANGFYLIAPNSFASGNGSIPDATYSTSSAQLVSNGAVYISYSASADTDVVDLVGWGTSTKKEGTAAADIAVDTSIERKAQAHSDASDMAVHGEHSFSGNGQDESDNSSDFVVQSSPLPQYSLSAAEFAFGAEFNSGGDTISPTVTDSFPSASTSGFIPADLDSAGADFSEQVDPGSVDTNSVSLVVDSNPGSNLCDNVQYDPFATLGAAVTCEIDGLALPLDPVPHTFTISTGVQDLEGNPLDSDYVVNFTPSGSISFDSQAAPEMVGSFPSPHSISFPPNGGLISVNFNQELEPSSLGGAITLENVTQGQNENISGISLLSIVDQNDAIELDVTGVSFTPGEQYRVSIASSVTSYDGVNLAEDVHIPFTVADANDTTGPVVVATFPSHGDTDVSVGMPHVIIMLDDSLNFSTVDSSSVQLMQGTDVLPSTISYNPDWGEIEVTSSAAFDPNTLYKVRMHASGAANEIENTSGTALQDTDGNPDTFHVFTFTTGGADVTAPTTSFATATQNSIEVTFSEMMLPSSIENLANWSLESPVGSSVPLSPMADSEVAWDPGSMTATLTGFSLTAGYDFEITAGAGIKDMANNPLSGPETLGGPVMDVATFGEDHGPGSGFSGDIWDMPAAFSTSEFGHVPQAEVMPMNGMAGMASNYEVNFPISDQIRSSGNGGRVILTFPSGFDVAGASASATNPNNIDVNGPGAGLIAVDNVTANAVARTVTVDFTVATRCGSGNTDPCVSGDVTDFIGFSLSGIVNTAVPRDWETSGYTVNIKTMTNSTLLETLTSIPFFINAAGNNDLTVDLTAGGVSSGTFLVHAWSPTTGELTQVIDFSVEADGTAEAVFTGLPEDFFDIWTDPLLSIDGTDDFQGLSNEPVWVSGSASVARVLDPTSGFQSVTVNVTGATGKDIDIIASGPDGFQVKRIASTTGSDSVTMRLPDGEWNFDIGPHMPLDGGFIMPAAPDYTVSPSWLPVTVANPNVTESSGTADDGTITFDLGAAAFTVPVNVVDTAGNPIVDAMVSIDDTRTGFHTFARTSTTGEAPLRVDAGTYRVNAFMRGAPASGELRVKVDGAGNIYQDGSTAAVSAVTLELSKGGTVISGTVTDGTSPVGGAGVHAFCTANCEGYFDAGTMSDASGAYTLYVENGTWNVQAFIPGYGPTDETTIAVNGADETGVNLEPDSSATFRTISGTVCEKAGGDVDCTTGTGLAGIEVFAYSEANGGGSNFTQTAGDGTYSLRVPGASGYTVEAIDHRAGPLPSLTGVDTSSGNATSQDIVIDTPEMVTVNIKDSGDSPVTLTDLFIEFFDDTTNIRQHLFIEDANSGVVNLPEGTYDVFVHAMSAPIDPVTDVLTDNGGGTVVTSGVLTVDGAEIIKIVVPGLSAISGQLTDGSGGVADAWIEVSDPVRGIFMGTVTDSSGNYSIDAPDGAYQVNAFSPGLIMDAVSLAVSGPTTLNPVGAVTDKTISGAITDPSGNPVPYAFVTGVKDGGKVATTQANANGEYALPVDDGDWVVTGNGYGYESKQHGSVVPIDGSSATSKDVQLTQPETGLRDPTVTNITPSEGGMASDADLGLNVTIPSNATSTSSSAGTLSMKETNNVVSTATTDVIGNGFEVSMTDNGGTQLTSGFTEEVTIERTMTVAELAAAGITTAEEIDDLTMSYFSSNGTWVPEATTTTKLDASGDIVTGNTMVGVTDVRFKVAVDHFTVFSITAPSDGVAPASPTNVSATAGSSDITITWDAVTTNSDLSAISDLVGYEIYRDTSSGGSFTNQLNGSDILTTSYTDSTASSGTTYFYKVTAADTGGLESSKSTADSASWSAGAGTVVSGGGGGGGSQATVTTQTPTTETTDDTETTEATEVAEVLDTTSEADQALGIVRDSENRRVAADSGEVGVSPANGEVESISSVSEGQFVRSYSYNTVYYIDNDLVRRPFWDAKSFLTWAQDWDDIVWVTDATLSTMNLSDPMLPQPGRILVKIESDPRVYAIEADPLDATKDILRWIPTEEVAMDIYGADWSSYIIDVQPTAFIRYSVGADLSLGESIDTSEIQTRAHVSGN